MNTATYDYAYTTIRRQSDSHKVNVRCRVPGNQRYVSPGKAYVEGDASSASYFLAGATITGGTVTVEGCGSDSLQGDVRFAEVMELMGAKVEWQPYSIKITGPTAMGQPIKAVDHNCNDIPDAAMTLAVVALFAEGQCKEGR